jgi:transposase
MKRYICKEKQKDGRIKVRIISKEGRKRIGAKQIGVAHNEKELKTLEILAQNKIKDKQQREFDFVGLEEDRVKIEHKASYSKYLYDTISGVYERIKLGEIDDEVFKQITIARIIRPASKIETIEILKSLGLRAPSNAGIHRSLRDSIKKNYRNTIMEGFIKHRKIRRARILLYDVTTLYFEIDKEDEYRKRGFSKERRLEPQIVVGLLVDEKGFPLGISSFEGNKAETKTMLPVLKEFRKRCGVKELTVVADAGMMSSENLEKLEEEGFKFIIGSRVAKTPYEIEEYRRKENEELYDGQIIETMKGFTNKATGEIRERRVVYQYKSNRAELDMRNIDKQIKAVLLQIENKTFLKKPRFLKMTESKKELDEKLIKIARLKAGIKGYVTNLDCEGEIVINGYHNLFSVEKSFRMTKSDLKARPIYHQTRDSIEAHLTVCFAALGIICRYIQEKTGISIKKFVSKLEVLRTAIIKIGDNEYTAEPQIDEQTQDLTKLL